MKILGQATFQNMENYLFLQVNIKFISPHHHQAAVVYCVDLFSPSSSEQSPGSSAHSLQQGKKKQNHGALNF